MENERLLFVTHRQRLQSSVEISALQKGLQKIDEVARQEILAERKKVASKITIEKPEPYATWEFDDSFEDSLGELDAKAIGGAKLENGCLVLDGKGAYVESAPLDKNLGEKT